MTELEQQLRRHLQERAEAGPDPTELREAVRQRLETIDDGRRPARPQHSWLVAAAVVGLIAALGAGLLWLMPASDSDGDIAQELGAIEVPTPVDVAGRPLESESFRMPFTLIVPDDVGLDVRLATDSPQAIELSLGSGDDAGEPATLRLVSSPSLLTVESVVEDLTAGLVQTRLLGVEDGAIGGYRSRVVRMQSELGMTLAGFKLGPGTFLSASGVDRRYDAHVVMTPGGVLVVWVDAPVEEFDEAADAAGAIVSTLRWRS
ncbi:MAG: hypothetical protein WCA57_02135 [Ilumatobacteraceae bacterium]